MKPRAAHGNRACTASGPASSRQTPNLPRRSVVVADRRARIDIIDPLGNTVEYYTAPLGAIAFAPIGTGMYHVVLTDAEGVVQTREVNVLPNPAPNAWVGIEASTATAAIGEAYSVGWNSTGGGVAIVRVTPGRDANSPDGVFHNATSGHAVFVNHAPGRYCYSIQWAKLPKWSWSYRRAHVPRHPPQSRRTRLQRILKTP